MNLNPILYLKRLQRFRRVSIALAKGATGAAVRDLDPTQPATWEFSAFSQNGEDGILDYLVSRLRTTNRYFVEIGASDGLENNSSWLAIGKRFSGLMIEGSSESSRWCERTIAPLTLGVRCLNLFVSKRTVAEIRAQARCPDPDVFSLDIDGSDYYVAETLLDGGFSPQIIAVEYNSAFGPTRKLTVPYAEDFRIAPAYPERLRYGVSIAAWRHLFERRGYRFVTVDLNGVNAFFARESSFEPAFLDGLRGAAFRENFNQLNQYGFGWEGQLRELEKLGPSLPLAEV